MGLVQTPGSAPEPATGTKTPGELQHHLGTNGSFPCHQESCLPEEMQIREATYGAPGGLVTVATTSCARAPKE